MNPPPPSTADWGDTAGDLDLDYAFRKFGGKTYQEAINLFETTDLLSRVEDLSVMPDKAFRYYMLAYRDFVLSPRVFGSTRYTSTRLDQPRLSSKDGRGPVSFSALFGRW